MLPLDLLTGFSTSNGVLQPFKALGWWQWMWYVTPYKWLVEGVVGQGDRFVTSFTVCIF